MRLRARLTIRNDHIIQARTAMGMSQQAFAEFAGVSMRKLMDLEALNYSGSLVCLRESADKVALAADIPVGLVLPEELLGEKLETTKEIVRDFDARALAEARDLAETRLIEDSGRESASFMVDEIMEKVDARLNRLEGYKPANEVKALRKAVKTARKYFLTGKSLEDMGRHQGVTRERVRQKIVKGINFIQDTAGRVESFFE